MLHVLGLSFRHTVDQIGVAAHILLPTAVGAVKSSGSGPTPLHSLASLSFFHIVALECQRALDPIVWKEWCHTDAINLARLVNATWWRC
jgi:hypothetical protein